MSTPAAPAAAAAPSTTATPAAATGGAASTGTTPAAGATPVDPKASAAAGAGGTAGATPATPATGVDGKATEQKPAAEPAPSEAERRLLAQVGRASKAEREAGQQVAQARAKIAELEAVIAGHGTVTERAKAADALETSLKDLKGAVKLLAKHGHKFEDVVKAWGSAEEESPELAELRAEQAKLREAQEKRDKVDADAKKDRETAEARAAFEEGIKEAKSMLTADEKRWRLASNADDADEVVDSVRTSVAQHIADKKKADKGYVATEEQVREMFAKGFDQAEAHLRGKAKRYQERLAADEQAAADAKTKEAAAAVAEAAAVTPKTAAATKGRVMGAPSDPLGRKPAEPAVEEASRTITAESRGALPMPAPVKPPLTGGRREMGRPVTPLGGR